VALGLLARGSQRLGERVRVHYLGTTIEASVVKTPFIDPSGARLLAGVPRQVDAPWQADTPPQADAPRQADAPPPSGTGTHG
jgi:hypothetical protein